MKRPSPILFVIAAIAIGLALAGAWSYFTSPFQFASGPTTVSLVRGLDDVITYTVKYQGAGPAVLDGALIILKGQILHVKVSSVDLIAGENDPGRTLPADGKLPPDQQIQLQPGDTIQFRLNLHGDTRGSNYMGGFRLMFRMNGLSLTQDVRLSDEYIIYIN